MLAFFCARSTIQYPTIHKATVFCLLGVQFILDLMKFTLRFQTCFVAPVTTILEKASRRFGLCHGDCGWWGKNRRRHLVHVELIFQVAATSPSEDMVRWPQFTSLAISRVVFWPSLWIEHSTRSINWKPNILMVFLGFANVIAAWLAVKF